MEKGAFAVSKQNLWHLSRISPFLLALVIGTTPVSGQTSTATATISVTATVLSSCTLTAQPLAFGNYSAVILNATTTLSVTCTNGSAYTVALDLGTGSGATVSARKMTYNTTNTLNYGLYQDSGHATIWGNTTGTNTEAGTGTGSLQTLTVYGSIPASQFVVPGSYSDTVTATITF
jgi:spore coat protein U-like protein